MEAYKEFAAIYDELINSDIDYNQWSKKIIELIHNYGIDKNDYLDLACGTGNMTALIAPFFKNSFGADMSEDMLIEADDKLRKLKTKVNFICQDMRFLNFNRNFDLITCCLDSLNYITDIDDLEKTFKVVSNHLKQKGLFIFDMNSYYKLTEIIGNNIFNFNSEDVVYIWENSLEDDIVNMFLTFFVKNGELYERFDEEHAERAYSEEVIERVLKKCNLEIIKKMDNYSTEQINENTERIVYITRKIE